MLVERPSDGQSKSFLKVEGLKHLQSRISFFAPCIVKKIININQQIAPFFSKHVHVEIIVKIKIKIYYKNFYFVRLHYMICSRIETASD
jgi:hypothetical protein